MAEPKLPGTVITFYSFKGGVGRSQALANAAFLLAGMGKRVCAIDWDLEAPGLHRYFHPFLADPQLLASEGLVDYLWEVSAQALTPGSQNPPPAEVDILDYVVAIDWEFEPPGVLDFIPAGRQGVEYAARAGTFPWDSFYTRMGGGKAIESARQRLCAEYDYVLIDSRTGISDTSGVCTVQLPDRLVACYTLNRQNIEGVLQVLESVTKQRQGRPLTIFPLEMRVETNEKLKLEAIRSVARPRFEAYLSMPSSTYWLNMEVAYIPFYALEECLAVFGDDPSVSTKLSMLDAMKAVTAQVAGLPRVESPDISAADRRWVRQQFAIGAPVDEVAPLSPGARSQGGSMSASPPFPSPTTSLSQALSQSPSGSSSSRQPASRWDALWAEVNAQYREWDSVSKREREPGPSGSTTSPTSSPNPAVGSPTSATRTRFGDLMSRSLLLSSDQLRRIDDEGGRVPSFLLNDSRFVLYLTRSRAWRRRRQWQLLALIGIVWVAGSAAAIALGVAVSAAVGIGVGAADLVGCSGALLATRVLRARSAELQSS